MPYVTTSTGAMAAFAWPQYRRVRASRLYVPLAITVWIGVRSASVHATIAGVALATAAVLLAGTVAALLVLRSNTHAGRAGADSSRE